MQVNKAVGSVLAVLVLVAGAVTVFVATLDLAPLTQRLVRQIAESSGYQVTIAGDVALDLLPNPVLVVEGVTVANPSWASQPELLRVKRIEGAVALRDLLSGRLRVTRVRLVEPVIFLETSPEGHPSWIAASSDAPPDEGAQRPFSISRLLVERGHLVYTDGERGTRYEVGIPGMDLRAGDDSTLSALLRIEYQGQSISGSMTVDSFADLVADRAFELTAALQAGAVSLRAAGTVRSLSARRARLSLVLASQDASLLQRVTDVDLGHLAPFRVTATARLDGGRIVLTDARLALPAGTLAGELDLSLSTQPPSLLGRLWSADLALDRLLRADRDGRRPGDGSEADDGRLIPPVAAPVPGPAEVRLSIRLDRAAYHGIVFEQIQADVTMSGRRLHVAAANAGLAGGRLSGELELLPTPKGARAAVTLAGRGVALGSVVSQYRRVEVFTGAPTDFDLMISGEGGSLRSLVASLDGKLRIEVGEARVDNRVLQQAGVSALARLGRLVNPFAAVDQFTRIHCGVVRADIEDGVARSEDGIALETDKLNVIGGGNVNLGTEALDLGFRPEPREGVTLGIGTLAGLVRVGGTLGAPAPVADTGRAATGVATVGAAIATGGLSLLAQGALARFSADQRPCRTALDEPTAASDTRGHVARRGGRAAEDGMTPAAATPDAAASTDTSDSGSNGQLSPTEALKGLGGRLKAFFDE